MGSALFMTTLAGLSTGVGGLFAVIVQPGEALLAGALGFAAGVMLTVSLGDLLPAGMAFYMARFSPLGAGLCCGVMLLLGSLLAGWMEQALPEGEPENRCRADTPEEAHRRGQALHCGLTVGLALLLHNLPEGILTLFSGIQDLRSGMRIALAIALHNIPEGISVAAPLYYATRKRGRSVGAALLSGLAEPAGALLAYGVLAPLLTPLLLNCLTLLAAGIMAQVSVSELLFGGFSLQKKGAVGVGFAAGVCGMTLGIAILA